MLNSIMIYQLRHSALFTRLQIVHKQSAIVPVIQAVICWVVELLSLSIKVIVNTGCQSLLVLKNAQ